MDGSSIAANLTSVIKKIRAAEKTAGRLAGSVSLIAVSKTKPLQDIQAAVSAGQIHFGENYVQEALEKTQAMSEMKVKCAWHFIGHLQTNKAKQVVGVFDFIHSVDRAALLEILQKEASKKSVRQKILLEVNLGGEQSKSGISPDKVLEILQVAVDRTALEVCGLMALPPLGDERESRQYFATLRELLKQGQTWLEKNRPHAASSFVELSMGTSHDYEWAVLEGATMVRVGTEIFGSRS